METIDKVISSLGAADIDARLEELLVDGILYAFQEQVGDLLFVMFQCLNNTESPSSVSLLLVYFNTAMAARAQSKD